MIMNKLENLFLVLGMYLFLVFSMSISDYSVPVINYFSPPLRIDVPSYNFDSIVSGITSIICLSISLVVKFKKLTDLRQKNESDMILAVKDLDEICPPNYFV